MPEPLPFTAVVLAADRTERDAVAQAAAASCKALSPIGGIPMVLRVLDALAASTAVAARILCGPPWPAVEQENRLRAGIERGEYRWLESRETPSASAYMALQAVAEETPVLLTTADHALLRPEMIDYFCRQARAGGYDVAAAVVRHEQVAGAYPQIRRTVLKFRDGGYCTCNLFAFMTPRSRSVAEYWRQVENQRKKPLRVVAGVLGWGALLRYLVGWLSLDEALERLSQRLGVRSGVVVMPFPEAGIDVDTVDDWMLVRRLVEGH